MLVLMLSASAPTSTQDVQGTVRDAEQAEDYQPCTPMDDHAKKILEGALDAALTAHVQSLFSILLKDPTGQPDRALAGARRAVEAYQNARNALAVDCKDKET
jgi:hypothetical protein